MPGLITIRIACVADQHFSRHIGGEGIAIWLDGVMRKLGMVICRDIGAAGTAAGIGADDAYARTFMICRNDNQCVRVGCSKVLR
ncbi:MAG: hypothetical protein ACXU8A_14915, partial [Burkholderiaceae bacterium]